ncbi:hypothetical protein TcWFU_001748 [Taenia crassiceps]|uniref:Inner membrane protein n=1 Tax=Taenia crassiceps TaxID=6207 RepID=A0ABR4Q317_9CEST
MESEVELTQKSHKRFNECFRNILSLLIFSGFVNVIGFTAATIITINSFRYNAEVQFTVASFLIIVCTLLAGITAYLTFSQSRCIQKIYEAQLISLIQLETSNSLQRGASSQTIVFLDPTMLGGPIPRGVTPPSYASVVRPTEETREN